VTEHLPIAWVSDTMANPPAEPEVIVEGLLRQGELCVVAAPRAVGKSWLMANLAVLVARGHGRFMGELAVRGSCPVLYCQGEIDPWAAFRRWKLLLGSEMPGPIAECFEPWRINVRRVRTSVHDECGTVSEDSLEGLLDSRVTPTVTHEGIGLLIIDPWASFFGGDENSNDQVEAALRQLRSLAAEHGTAIVIVHHLHKATEGRDPEDLWRGASRLADWATTRVTLQPHYSGKDIKEKNLDPGDARRHVDVRFLRRHEPTDPFTAYLGSNCWWERRDIPEA